MCRVDETTCRIQTSFVTCSASVLKQFSILLMPMWWNSWNCWKRFDLTYQVMHRCEIVSNDCDVNEDVVFLEEDIKTLWEKNDSYWKWQSFWKISKQQLDSGWTGSLVGWNEPFQHCALPDYESFSHTKWDFCDAWEEFCPNVNPDTRSDYNGWQ